MFPYVIDHGIPGLRFKVVNEEARAWYDPLKSYTLLEYQWVRENVKGNLVIDAGCHHGNYSIVFKPATVVGVDCVPLCCETATENASLNEVAFLSVEQRLGEDGVRGNYAPDVYKVDIEGAEFQLLPKEVDRFPMCRTWIVEIHPRKGKVDELAQAFLDRGFSLLKVDREKMIVRPYELGEKWPTHATLIARYA